MVKFFREIINIKNLVWLFVLIILIHTSAAILRYRFLHPEMTETQLLENLGEILTLK